MPGDNNEDVDFGTGYGNYIGSTHLVTNAYPRLTVTYYGDVGIGTQQPSAKLDVIGKTRTDSLQVDNGAVKGHILQSDSFGNAYWSDPDTISDGDWEINGNNIYNANSGYVGIGTPTPIYPFDVHSSAYYVANFETEASAGMYVAISEDGSYRGYWGSYAGDNNEDVDFGTGYGNYIGSTHLVTNAYPRLTVTYYGDVGIGTQQPSAKLDVIGKTRTDSFQVDIGAVKGHILQSDSFGNAYWSDPDTISDGDWEFNGNDIYNANSGNVGIGTPTPIYPFDVHSSAYYVANFETEASAGMYVAFSEDGSYRGYWGSYAGLNNEDVDFGTGSGNYIGSTHLVTNASPKLTVTYPGDVGIGTQLPSAKLDVIGKTRTDSFQLDIGAVPKDTSSSRTPLVMPTGRILIPSPMATGSSAVSICTMPTAAQSVLEPAHLTIGQD